jgi:adenylylsulfate kinase
MNGWTLWFTGLPASGKTTLARALWQDLQAQGIHAVLLDSDELRAVLTPHPTYSPAERDDFYRTVVQLARLINDFGVNVLVAATAPRRAYRDVARHTLPRFAEIWVRCPIEVCQQRDPKHLYQRAQTGAIDMLPGIQIPYEYPIAPDLILDSDELPVTEAVSRLIELLTAKGWVGERAPVLKSDVGKKWRKTAKMWDNVG